MAKRILLPESELPAVAPLSVEELEIGLLRGAGGAFRDEHVEAFRETVIAAIRETSDLLRTEDMPPRWRARLDRQVRHMRHYVEIADLYLARRSGEARELLN
jgi:hypothetical protein